MMEDTRIKKVMMYEVTDGMQFTSISAAMAAQRLIDMRERVLLLVQKSLNFGDASYDEIQMTTNFIVNNPDKVLDAIRGKDDNVQHEGYEVGEKCNRICEGILIKKDIDGGCSCHTGNAPCSYCTAGKVECLACGWEMPDA